MYCFEFRQINLQENFCFNHVSIDEIINTLDRLKLNAINIYIWHYDSKSAVTKTDDYLQALDDLKNFDYIDGYYPSFY